MNDNFETDNRAEVTSTDPPLYYTKEQPSEDEEQSPVFIRRRVKGGYNHASAVFLWQQVFGLILMTVFSLVFSAVVIRDMGRSAALHDIAASEPGSVMSADSVMDAEKLKEAVAEKASTPEVTIIMNSVCMTIADLLAVLVVLKSSKRFKLEATLQKPRIAPSGIALAAAAILGIQGVSVYIQSAVMSLTGYTGMSEELAAALSFSDSTAANVLLLLYAVILGPILEELMFRSLALNLLAPVNRSFALIVSSLMFGLMHCNFNQIFNGFLLGLLLGYIALKSGSVIPSVICHICANANAFLIEIISGPAGSEETGTVISMVIFAAEVVLGIVAGVFLLRKYGRVEKSDIIVREYSYGLDEGEEKALMLPALLKSPAFWVMLVLCIASACANVTAIRG